MQIFRQFTANNITLEPFPFRKELAMEAYLIENESILQLDEVDFSEVEILDAEIALKEGRKSAERDGRIDILARYGADYLGIVELKLDELRIEHLEQLEDYLRQSQQIIEKYPEYWKELDRKPKWIGILVGKSAEKDLIEKVRASYKFNGEIPIAIITLNRFRYRQNNEIIVVSDSYFSFKYSSKDYSTFRFNNNEYNKTRLPLAVLKHYVSENTSITFAELENKFPKSLQGTNWGVFSTIETAEKVYNETGYRRFHMKPEDLIELTDSTIAVCSNWGVGNIPNFINQAKKLGLQIN
jgi:hypothetical protein